MNIDPLDAHSSESSSIIQEHEEEEGSRELDQETKPMFRITILLCSAVLGDNELFAFFGGDSFSREAHEQRNQLKRTSDVILQYDAEQCPETQYG